MSGETISMNGFVISMSGFVNSMSGDNVLCMSEIDYFAAEKEPFTFFTIFLLAHQ